MERGAEGRRIVQGGSVAYDTRSDVQPRVLWLVQMNDATLECDSHRVSPIIHL
jgi:hypothetical protein